MKFIAVLTTVFSVCYCFSDLNALDFETTGRNFHPLEKPGLNSLQIDEEILKCLYFMDNIDGYLNQISSQEELEDKLSKCSLLLQKSTKLSARKDYNNIDTSFKSINSQDNDFVVSVDSTANFEEINNKNNEVNEIFGRTFDGKENDVYSELFSDLYENIKEVTTEATFQLTTESPNLRNSFLVNRDQNEANPSENQPEKPEYQKTETVIEIISPQVNTGWSLWNVLFGTSESAGNSSSNFVAEQNENQPEKPEDQNTQSDIVILSPISTGWSFWSFFSGARESTESSSSDFAAEKNEKQTDKSKDQKLESDIELLSSINPVWSFWSWLYDASDSSNSSEENRPEIFFERNKTTESFISFENSTYIEFTTSEAGAWNLIMPGTKWCGSGSIAKHDDDLGYFADVDKCCRAHDKCDDLMLSGESKHNLTNTSPFTVLNCKCDDELYECLSKINSVASNTIGNTFFNIFARMCYTLDYPKKCKEYSSLYLGCLEYEIDKTAEKVYQWKPAKKYLKTPFAISN